MYSTLWDYHIISFDLIIIKKYESVCLFAQVRLGTGGPHHKGSAGDTSKSNFASLIYTHTIEKNYTRLFLLLLILNHSNIRVLLVSPS